MSSTDDTTLLARYQRRLASVARQDAPGMDPVRQTYRHAAAVLDCFTFASLHPAASGLSHDNPRALLFDDTQTKPGGMAQQWFTLVLPVRIAALRELGSRAAMRRALERNPERPMTPLQAMWEAYLATGTLPALDEIGYGELALVCEILSWLDGLDPQLPPLGAAHDWLRRRSILASFEHLVDLSFTGRTQELELIRKHIGVPPPSHGLAVPLHQLRMLLPLTHPLVLAVHGPGGVGKSALIGKLLLEHSKAVPGAQIPFAYLAFDQASMRIDATFTILREAAAQLELQFPGQGDVFAAFRATVLQFRDERGALVSGDAAAPPRQIAPMVTLGQEEKLHAQFGKLLHAIGRHQAGQAVLYTPVMLVFDTFEEVQYRDKEDLSPFWRMLKQLHLHYPQLRVIICGRAALSSHPSYPVELRQMALGELAFDDRCALLGKLGVTNDHMAAAIADQVGGNPLTLRLAARVALTDPAATSDKGIDNLVTRRLLLFQIDAQLVQGQLYRRVLQHIHDPRVRSLAHPGMVLRRIDPEVIVRVLAPVCLPDLARAAEPEQSKEAWRLFNELRREHALVTFDATDGALVYRADIRNSLMRLLEHDRYGDVRRLRRAAIAFYQEHDGVSARAEELYHRLALGDDDPALLDARWLPGVESLLAPGLDDYPDTMKAWLASRMSLEVPRDVFMQADIAYWERNITRKIQAALSEGRPQDALMLLRERDSRSADSPLYALEAKAHLMNESARLAIDALERGIQAVPAARNRGRLAELWWLKAQAFLLNYPPKPDAADHCLAQAQLAMEQSGTALPLMHILAQRLLLRQAMPQLLPAATAALEHQLATLCLELDEEQLRGAGLVSGLAAQLVDPVLFPEALERLHNMAPPQVPADMDTLTGDNLQGLDSYRHPWELLDAASLKANV